MHTRIVHPDALAPEELDAYLADGWYRIGQTLMSCRFVVSNGSVRSAVWTRLPIARFQLSKSNRKLLRRNRSRYTIRHGPRVLDEQHEALYRRYLTIVDGDRSPSLRRFLYGGATNDAFATEELSLWDGDQLVAFSWFDIGRDSLQSLIGVYTPDRRQYSLGFTTMLLEIEHAAQLDLQFHYSGYVLPGERSMEYKRRVGNLEFLHPDSQDWQPIEHLDTLELPVDRIRRALGEASDELAAHGVPSAVRTYPMYEAPHQNPRLSACVDQPLVLVCFPARQGPTAVLVTWSLDTNRYEWLHCARASGRMIPEGATEEDEGYEVDLWVTLQRLGEHADAGVMARDLSRRLARRDRVRRSPER